MIIARRAFQRHRGRLSSNFYNCSPSSTLFSSSSLPKSEQDDDKKTKANQNISITATNKAAIDATTTSIGQVIFLNSSKSGTAILASLAIGDPTLAAFAGLGAYTATMTAHSIGCNQQSCRDGLFGYNGALIGCATSVFGPSFLPFAVANTILGASATSVLCASLNKALSQPQWTWSFNIVALTSLLRMKPMEPLEEIAATDVAATTLNVVASPLVGVSQIFVVNSVLTGAGIVGSIAMYSPKLGVHALGGSTLGCLVGLLFGNLEDVIFGLWGYNSALASMAVGTFFVHSREAVALSAGSAVASAAVFGALQPVFGGLGAPCLTLPFCAVASACYLLDSQVSGLKLAKEPHSPEKNA
ncbi:hypothetical protein ACHAWT_007949 [Skeletonema menzelii]